MAEFHVPINGIRHWVQTVGDLHAATPVVVLHGGPGGFIYDFEQLTGPALEQLGPVVYYETTRIRPQRSPARRPVLNPTPCRRS